MCNSGHAMWRAEPLAEVLKDMRHEPWAQIATPAHLQCEESRWNGTMERFEEKIWCLSGIWLYLEVVLLSASSLLQQPLLWSVLIFVVVGVGGGSSCDGYYLSLLLVIIHSRNMVPGKKKEGIHDTHLLLITLKLTFLIHVYIYIYVSNN